MAASKPTSRLFRTPHPFTLNHDLGTLSGICFFPFDHGPCASHSLSAEVKCFIFGVLQVGKDFSPQPLSALPQTSIYSTHYLNSFRGKPAIYEFGWPFTPYHKSSKDFSTSTGSVSGKCYPAFNLLMVSSFVFGSIHTTNAHLRLAFAAPTPLGLSLLDKLSH